MMPSSGILEGLTVFAENTGLVVGRTLVDPSHWSIPVLVSNFGQDTVTEDVDRSSHDSESLLVHLRNLLDQMSRDLDVNQQHQLAGVLLRYTDLFPTPGSTLTGHTDTVEHEIDTGDESPIRCTPPDGTSENEERRGVSD